MVEIPDPLMPISQTGEWLRSGLGIHPTHQTGSVLEKRTHPVVVQIDALVVSPFTRFSLRSAAAHFASISTHLLHNCCDLGSIKGVLEGFWLALKIQGVGIGRTAFHGSH
jgi:hypothetical protein